MNYLIQLLSSDDAAADIIAWCSAVAVLGLIALMIFEAVTGHPPGITEAGTGLATVIGAGGAIRIGRERFSRAVDDHAHPDRDQPADH